ncbi:hypothetical protein BHAOGJBA_2905 [Methylobacterium hispanicum]|uniref:Helicase XPB/Ssl2 N-terminal domain-containing protein n=1 Tax=Methylobacterium hispanicum TaxID=270350 RepID=A0AAV4ZM57_9HYPH|nr:hypothetical protein [Methylobacterium hispanicum]GJD89378.1 hypothetical protein BHAOGJBA_2905 [Methylobacterium hispanicum]
METSTSIQTGPSREGAETALREAAAAVLGMAPMKSRIDRVFAAGFGREDWEANPGTWNVQAAAEAVSKCYSLPCDPSKAMAVSLRLGAVLGSRPAPSEDDVAAAFGISRGWMPLRPGHAGDLVALAREGGFAELGRALVDEVSMSPALLSDMGVDMARGAIAAAGTPEQVALVAAALPELRRVLHGLFSRPRHPAWPALTVVLLSLQALRAAPDDGPEGALGAVKTLFSAETAASPEALRSAAAALSADLDHRGRAAVVARMIEEIALCIVQATVLSGADLGKFGREMLAREDLPASPFGLISSTADLFWPAPDEDALGAADEPGWHKLVDGERVPRTEWHRVTVEEDAAADLLCLCGRPDLAGAVTLRADPLFARTVHIVGRGLEAHLVAPAGMAVVERRLVAGRGRFSYAVEIVGLHLVPGETGAAVEALLARSVEDATATDLPRLADAHSGTAIDIRCTVSPLLASTELGRVFSRLSADGVSIRKNSIRETEDLVLSRRRAAAALAGEIKSARAPQSKAMPAPAASGPGRPPKPSLRRRFRP